MTPSHILQNDIRRFEPDLLDLVTAPEVIAIAQDSQCVKGSLARAEDAWEIWIRPLSDGSFAATVLNKGSSTAHVAIKAGKTGIFSDFFPARFEVTISAPSVHH